MRKLALLLAVVIMTAFVFAAWETFSILSTAKGTADEQVTFLLEPGVPFRQILTRLQQQGLIDNEFSLLVFAKVTGWDRKMRHGEYALNRGMTALKILETLASGKSILYPFTFPEGANMYDVANALEAKGFFTAKDFLEFVKNPEEVKALLGEEHSSLEGYLFPETYSLTRFTTLKELVTSMVRRFKTVYDEVSAQLMIGAAGNKLTMSRHEIVTLASIIEKETGAPEERPLISSIFHNRLKIGMRLQTDPTIMYGILVQTGVPKMNITKQDLLTPTLYNTYTIKALPPGPIANPGREALLAAMKPAESKYLYFVSRNNGTHEFSEDYGGHKKAVQSFQLNAKAREGKSWRDLGKKQPMEATKSSVKDSAKKHQKK